MARELLRPGAVVMERARPLESNPAPAGDRGAAAAAPRSTPLTIVSGAVAGDDLLSVAASTSDALGRPVTIAIPSLGEPVVWPRGAIAEAGVRTIVEHAAAVIREPASKPPEIIADAVPVRIGHDVVGIIAVTPSAHTRELAPEQLAWLEAGAAGAAVSALLRDAQEGGLEGSRRALLQALRTGPPADVSALVSHARRLGFDLGSGAVALCASPPPDDGAIAPSELLSRRPALLADVGHGRLCGLVPISSSLDGAQQLAAELSGLGMLVALSGPRRDPATLHDALREAELLVELSDSPGGSLAGQEETYRLLIGILLRGREELELLRSQTISPLSAYDTQHDTDLLATLQAFLAHHGSTTETAEAMSLHRHTVGYRLARVHEVSGLSPYESDGRERLSLGLKAHQILEADERVRGSL
jgi:PucR C-terminal helix-turn-helix domain/GGDEF-like domain